MKSNTFSYPLTFIGQLTVSTLLELTSSISCEKLLEKLQKILQKFLERVLQ